MAWTPYANAPVDVAMGAHGWTDVWCELGCEVAGASPCSLGAVGDGKPWVVDVD